MSKCSRSFIAIRNARIVVEASISDKINNYSCNAIPMIQPNTCLTVSPLSSFLIVSVGWTIDFLAKKWKRVKNGEEEKPCVSLLGAESRCSGGDKTPRQHGTMKTKRGRRRVEKKRAEGDGGNKGGGGQRPLPGGRLSFPIPFVHRMVNGNGRWETRLSMRNAGEFTWRDRNDDRPVMGGGRYRGWGRKLIVDFPRVMFRAPRGYITVLLPCYTYSRIPPRLCTQLVRMLNSAA